MIEQRPNIALERRRSPAGRIQVDMFDVQLGAALLIQYSEHDGEVVRVLADAGVDPRSCPQNHALAPIKQAMRDFDSGSLRLDLMIGTHYDADHLDGLIPIIEDRSIKITEAWMPPVANDTELHALEDEPEESRLLAKQFDSSCNAGSAIFWRVPPIKSGAGCQARQAPPDGSADVVQIAPGQAQANNIERLLAYLKSNGRKLM